LIQSNDFLPHMVFGPASATGLWCHLSSTPDATVPTTTYHRWSSVTRASGGTRGGWPAVELESAGSDRRLTVELGGAGGGRQWSSEVRVVADGGARRRNLRWGPAMGVLLEPSPTTARRPTCSSPSKHSTMSTEEFQSLGEHWQAVSLPHWQPSSLPDQSSSSRL
jgi:hypothetical protein